MSQSTVKNAQDAEINQKPQNDIDKKTFLILGRVDKKTDQGDEKGYDDEKIEAKRLFLRFVYQRNAPCSYQ